MIFTDVRTRVMNRLGLTSTDDQTRVDLAINDKYKEITSSLGIRHVSRRTTVNETTSIGISTLNFDDCEKIINVVNRNDSPYLVLDEVSVDELRLNQPYGAGDTPTKYAITSMDGDDVTIELNCIPQTEFALYADVISTVATLSGSDIPAFPISFHDALVEAVLIDEYLKLEKISLSQNAERRFKERMSDLRHWVMVSTTKDIYQGKTQTTTPQTGGAGGGSSVNGALSYTQTGLITFDRDPSAPFAVTSSSAVVSNLDADMVDGHHVTALAQIDGTANAGNLLFVDATYDIGASGATRPRDLFLSRNAVIGGTTTFGGNVVSNLLFTDATYDIGASGATRPRDLFLSRNAVIGGTLGVTGAATLSAASALTLDHASAILTFSGATAPEIYGTAAGALSISSNGGIHCNIDKNNDGSGSVFKVSANNTTDVFTVTEAGNTTITGIITGRDVTVISNTETGTQNNWSPSGRVTGTTYMEWAGASDITITGITGGQSGDVLIIRNNNTSVMYFAHNSGSSSVGNKLNNAVSSASTPVAIQGYIMYIYQGSVWRMIGHDQGLWITPTYAAGSYTAASGSWTVDSGDVTEMAYHLSGKTMSITWVIQTTDVSATPTDLRIAIPGGFTATHLCQNVVNIRDAGGAFTTGLARVTAGGTNIHIYASAAFASWSATSSDNTDTLGTLTFEVT